MMSQNSTIHSSDSRSSIGSPGWKLRSRTYYVRYVLLLRAPPRLRQLALPVVDDGLQHLLKARAVFDEDPRHVHLQPIQ